VFNIPGEKNMLEKEKKKPIKIYYDNYLKKIARELRKQSTLSEVLLWQKLRASQMMGYRFNRQRPIGKYIVDFFCKELKLVIEIDGDSHLNKWDEDIDRQTYLESIGLTVLRFYDRDVKRNINAVLFAIEGWIVNNRLDRKEQA
jgi:very-short-patch-repair endonuclease